MGKRVNEHQSRGWRKWLQARRARLLGMVRCARAAVALEFAILITLLVTMVLAGNEIFRVTQVADRTQQLAKNYAQTIAQKNNIGVSEASLQAVFQSGSVVLQPFVSSLSADVCEKAGPTPANPLYCVARLVAADDSCASKWRNVWRYGGGQGQPVCDNSCLTSLQVSGVRIYQDKEFANLSDDSRMAVVVGVYLYSPGVVSAIPGQPMDALQYFPANGIWLVSGVGEDGNIPLSYQGAPRNCPLPS